MLFNIQTADYHRLAVVNSNACIFALSIKIHTILCVEHGKIITFLPVPTPKYLYGVLDYHLSSTSSFIELNPDKPSVE